MGKEIKLNSNDVDAIKHEFAMMSMAIEDIKQRQQNVFKILYGTPIVVLKDNDSRMPKHTEISVNGYASHEDDTPETYPKSGRVTVESPDAERIGLANQDDKHGSVILTD